MLCWFLCSIVVEDLKDNFVHQNSYEWNVDLKLFVHLAVFSNSQKKDNEVLYTIKNCLNSVCGRNVV